jgi:hypothetical protein
MSEFQALLDEIERLEAVRGDDYWQSVYDRILDAWQKFALAELGTPMDLQNRPELAELYEAIR